MRSGHWRAAIAMAGILVAVLLPLSPALASSDARQARIIAAALTGGACAALGFVKVSRPIVWTIVAVVFSAAGLGLLLAHIDASSRCAATYDGRIVIIGRDYTQSAAEYVSRNPGLAAQDLLLDAGGAAERIWTAASISSCRFWIGSGGLLAVPLFAAAVGALTVRRDFRFAPAPPARTAPRAAGPPSPTAHAPVYDAFVSYRHTEPDRAHAQEILSAVESRGLRVAIDFRDFAPNQHFLSEMERCIKQSRFVLCVVTSRYLDSDHCSEEAIISKTLDLADRRKRLVPLIFEPVEVPVWLHGIRRDRLHRGRPGRSGCPPDRAVDDGGCGQSQVARGGKTTDCNTARPPCTLTVTAGLRIPYLSCRTTGSIGQVMVRDLMPRGPAWLL